MKYSCLLTRIWCIKLSKIFLRKGKLIQAESECLKLPVSKNAMVKKNCTKTNELAQGIKNVKVIRDLENQT